MRLPLVALAAALLILPFAQPAAAQSFDVIGTRAQGMGGAFVGVADDASAVYWNPGGLARGAFFSLLLDGTAGEASLDQEQAAGERSGWILALSTPALGLSYYRLRNAVVRPVGLVADSDQLRALGLEPARTFQFDSLVTHQGGVTLVQSLADGVAVGVTAKLVRGVAASTAAVAGQPTDLLEGVEALGRTSTKVDLDVGIMASGALGRVGLAIRNVSEPSFRTAQEIELELDRQVRGGASLLLLPDWTLAADVDLTKSQGTLGETRQVAIGTEGRVTRRLSGRGGVRMNTAGDRGRMPAWSVGGSYAVSGSVLIDAQATAGSDEALRGWGIAGRVVF